ncbi:MAG: DNA polymerase III subunit delta [Alphaproteobacteria bacterium]
MKLGARAIQEYLAAPERNTHACLIYGPDNGLVLEYGKSIRNRILGAEHEDFAFVEIDAASLADDTAILADELRTVHMLAPKRLIFIRDASDKLLPAVENSAEYWHTGAFLLVVAGELPPRSLLRSWFEDSHRAAALPCYHDDARSLRQVIQQRLTEATVQLDSETLDYLAHQLGNDRRVTLNEIEKICLYAGHGGRLSFEDARSLVEYNREAQLDDIAASVADRDLRTLDRELQVALQERLSPVAYIRAIQRYFNRLYYVRGQIDNGLSTEDAIKKLRPAVFFKELPRFTRHVQQWDANMLAHALARLVQAERACKTSDLPPVPPSSRAIFQTTQIRG